MCKKLVKALPFIVDPIGAVFRVPFSPGGALRNAIDPRREEPPTRKEPVVTGGGGGSVTVRRVQRPPETQQQQPQSDDDAFQRQRAGAGGSEDVTRGLIKPKTRRSLLA